MSLAFTSALEHRRGSLETVSGANGGGIGESESVSSAGSYDPRVRGFAVRMFSIPGQRVPQWVGLLSLLEDYVETHDDPRNCPQREWDATYGSAGWRCMAPGCTARVDLQNHHIVYRSDQGSDEPWNQVALCKFHHLQGEHGRFAMVRGRGPLDIIFRLGTPEFGRWYQNEKEIPAPTQ